MLMNALLLCSLKAGGMIAIYSKLPKRVQKFMKEHALAMDITVGILTYWILGGTLTALIAGGELCMIASVLLHIAGNPEKYAGIISGVHAMKNKLGEMIAALNMWALETFGTLQIVDAKLGIAA